MLRPSTCVEERPDVYSFLMAEHRIEVRHLNKAPIVEALIDFRVRPADGLTPETLNPVNSLLAPKHQRLQQCFGV